MDSKRPPGSRHAAEVPARYFSPAYGWHRTFESRSATRRVLIPGKELNALVVGCIACEAQWFGVRSCFTVRPSNHDHHLVRSDGGDDDGLGTRRSLGHRRHRVGLVAHRISSMNTSSLPTEPFRLGEWLVEPQLNRLARRDERRALEPRAMDLLVYLAQSPNETRSREDILDAVWGGATVIDGALYRAISMLRTGLDDDARSPRYVQTVPRRGYRLVASPVRLGKVETDPTAGGDSVVNVVGGFDHDSEDSGPLTGRSTAARTSPSTGSAAATRAGATLAALGLLILFGWAFTRNRPGPEPSMASPDEATQDPGNREVRTILVETFRGRGDGAGEVSFAATETILALLGGVEGLAVRAAGSDDGAFADAQLSGTVATSDDRVRITAKLTRAAEVGEHTAGKASASDSESREVIWGKVVEGRQDDLLLLEAELAAGLAIALGRSAPMPTSWSREVDPKAQRLYLAGRYHLRDRRPESFFRARNTFLQALEIAPGYADAHAALAETYLLLGDHLSIDEPEARELASAAAAAAERHGPHSPETSIALARVALDGNWDFERAEVLARRALAARPESDRAAAILAEALTGSGRWSEALEAIDAAVAAKPDSLLHLAQRGRILLHAGRFEEADRQFVELSALQPQYGWPTRYRVYALQRLGRLEEAMALAVEHADADPRFLESRIVELRDLIAQDGAAGHARWRLQNLRARRERGAEPHPAEWAEAYAGSDQPTRALHWIDVALEQRDDWLMDLLLLSPAFDVVRGAELDRRLQQHGLATRPPSESGMSGP